MQVRYVLRKQPHWYLSHVIFLLIANFICSSRATYKVLRTYVHRAFRCIWQSVSEFPDSIEIKCLQAMLTQRLSWAVVAADGVSSIFPRTLIDSLSLTPVTHLPRIRASTTPIPPVSTLPQFLNFPPVHRKWPPNSAQSVNGGTIPHT